MRDTYRNRIDLSLNPTTASTIQCLPTDEYLAALNDTNRKITYDRKNYFASTKTVVIFIVIKRKYGNKITISMNNYYQ